MYTKLLTILTLTAMLVMGLASPSFAADPGDIGVFFDPGGTATTACWASFTQTNNFYVVAFDVPGDLRGYEFGLVIDPTIIIFGSAMIAGPAPINVGSAPNNWIVGTGGCVNGAGAVTLVQFTAGYFVSPVTDLLICLLPSTPSSFAPATPGWLACDDSLIPFGVALNGEPDYPNGCAVLCPSAEPPVPVPGASVGTLKAAYK